MLKQNTMQLIQELKLQGYSQSEVAAYLKQHGQNVPSRPTIRKYYQMDVLPENPGEKLRKYLVFSKEPFRSAIIQILKNNPDCHISSIYDVLCEKFVDSELYEKLPGNEKTLRNYVHNLVNNRVVEREAGNTRIYEHVFDTPPGEQMLIDFGQIEVQSGMVVHFICLLLRYSRMFCVYAQDHKYNSEEACRAIYRSFCRLGGRPKTLVIDQDAVFIANETYGEVIETQKFREFCAEQDLKLWVCHKADPESKGPVENTVGFVKKNYFSGRKKEITCIDDVWRTLPAWLRRKSLRIHQSTYCVPQKVYEQFEKPALAERPVLPSIYDEVLSNLVAVNVKNVPYILYKSNRYSVPHECCFHKVYYRVVQTKLHIYNEDKKHICSHTITATQGKYNQLPEHAKSEPTAWIAVAEDMRRKWNCTEFQHLINGFKKENEPRHLYAQLNALRNFLDAEKPSKEFVAQVITECCARYRYRFTQFRDFYTMMSKQQKNSISANAGEVEKKPLSTYQKVFKQRCEESRVSRHES